LFSFNIVYGEVQPNRYNVEVKYDLLKFFG